MEKSTRLSRKSAEEGERKRHADRLVEVLTNTLSVLARDCRIVSKSDGSDVTTDAIVERARNGAQAIIGEFYVCPRGTR